MGPRPPEEGSTGSQGGSRAWEEKGGEELAEKETQRARKQRAEEGNIRKILTRMKREGQVGTGWDKAATYSQLIKFRKQHFSISFERKFSPHFLIYLYII